MSWKDIIKYDEKDVEEAKKIIAEFMGEDYFDKDFPLTASNFIEMIYLEIESVNNLLKTIKEQSKGNPYFERAMRMRLIDYKDELSRLLA
tara:strand:+ start:2716 stop:2985 length:270 start_codon:yes stop_codon:yes gene_type:complete